jgi:hypothetical protein
MFGFGMEASSYAAAGIQLSVPGPEDYVLAAAGLGVALRGAPTLLRDASGKIHGVLPKIHQLKRASSTQISETIEELRGSILTRRQELERLGEHGPHRARIGEEESLLRSLEKRLEDIFGAKNKP